MTEFNLGYDSILRAKPWLVVEFKYVACRHHALANAVFRVQLAEVKYLHVTDELRRNLLLEVISKGTLSEQWYPLCMASWK